MWLVRFNGGQPFARKFLEIKSFSCNLVHSERHLGKLLTSDQSFRARKRANVASIYQSEAVISGGTTAASKCIIQHCSCIHSRAVNKTHEC